METTPGKCCMWEVTKGYLPEALNELVANNIDLKDIKIVPMKIKVVDELFNATEFNVTSYLIIHYNPPANPIPGTDLDGAPATMQ